MIPKLRKHIRRDSNSKRRCTCPFCKPTKLNPKASADILARILSHTKSQHEPITSDIALTNAKNEYMAQRLLEENAVLETYY